MNETEILKKKIVDDIKTAFPEKEWDYRIEAIKAVIVTMSREEATNLAKSIVVNPFG